MNSSKNGMNMNAKVVELSRNFMLVDYCGKVYRIDFGRFPYFRGCFLSELYNVEASAEGLHWPEADIDIELEYLENPPAESSVVDLEWWKEQRKRLISKLNAIGCEGESIPHHTIKTSRIRKKDNRTNRTVTVCS